MYFLPGSSAQAAKAMEDPIFGEGDSDGDTESELVARPLARYFQAADRKWSLTTTLVGRLGLDPSTLRVFPERPGTSIIVQICWPDEVLCPPTSTEVLSLLTSWLDNWLDQGSFQGLSIIQFRGADGEEFKLLLAEE